MPFSRWVALRAFFARFEDALDRRPEDDLRDDVGRLVQRIETLEANHLARSLPSCDACRRSGA